MAMMTKKQVDQRAMSILNESNLCEKEKQLRYYGIGRMYYQIREFSVAKHYLENYIKTETCPKKLVDGYKTLIPTLEYLKDLEGALKYLKLLYEVQPTRATLNKICDLLESGYGEHETQETKNKWFERRQTAKASGIMNNSLNTSTPPQGPVLGHEETVLYSPLSSIPSPATKLTNGLSSPLLSKLRQPKFNANNTEHDHGHSSSHYTQLMTQMKTMESEIKLEIKNTKDSVATLEQAIKACVSQAVKDNIKDTLATLDQSMKACVSKAVKDNTKDSLATLEQAIKACVSQTVKETLEDVTRQNITQTVKDTAEEFKKVLNEMLSTVSFSQPGSGDSSVVAPQPPTKSDTQKPLSELFKKPEGSWSCPGCYLSNTKEQTICPSCETAQPGTEPKTTVAPAEPKKTLEHIDNSNKATVTPAPTFGTSQFAFGIKPAPTFGFKPVEPTVTPAVVQSSESEKTTSIFSFNKTPVAASETVVDKPIFSFNSSFSSFGDLAKQTPASGFSFTNPAPATQASIFNQPPKPLFSSPQSQAGATATTPRRNSTGRERRDSDVEDDFVPTAEFQPVIPLPDIVEVVRGDEDENTLFEIRAKLFRFDFERKEWKERGIGLIKILQHKTMKNKARVVMWREQIHKLACNFWISNDMSLDHHQNNPKHLKWTCVDFSEGDDRKELLLCKFAKEEQAEEFKKVLNEMISTVGSPQLGSGDSGFVAAQPSTKSDTQKPLSELFKKPEGSWTCTGCYLTNTKEQTVCPSCETAQPGIELNKGDQKEKDGPTTPNSTFYKPDWKTPEAIFSFKQTPVTANEAVVDKPIFSFNSSFSSFGDLAKQTPASGFSFTNTPPATQPSIFNQPPKPLFSSPQIQAGATVTTPRRNSTGRERRDSDAEDDFVPTAEFKPVIPLPELVEVVRGDEDENTLFEVRAKLFRFDFEKKEWKERGIGMIKVLQHKTMRNKARVVMWREQIHKLACNFWITNDMSLDNHQNNPKHLKWTCVDFSEGDDRKELLLCKFAKEEQAEDFKKVLNEMISTVSSPQPGSGDSRFAAPQPSTKSDTQKPLSELFKKPEGSWSCPGCYLTNTKEQTICPSCETAQPGIELNKGDQKDGPTTPNNTFYNPDWKTPDPNFSFKQTSVATSETVVDKPIFSFNSSFSSFGDLAKQTPASGFSFTTTTTQPSIFNQPPKPLFSSPQSLAGVSATTPRRNSTGRERRDSDAEDDFVPTAEFKPVIPLPDIVEVVRGDEDENTLFEIRAKLFRFDFEKKEWKERGIGMIKILQHKTMKNKARVVMWREQIHKLACNFWITNDMSLDHHQNNPKQLKWTCVDFSEGDDRKELLLCKFAKEQQAEEFKKVLNEMISTVGSPQPGSGESGFVAPQPASKSDIQKPLSELFKKPEGSWTCPGCYLSNTKEQTICPSCETAQPGTEPKTTVAPAPTFGTSQFTFGFKPVEPPVTLAEVQSSESEETTCPGCIGCDPDSFDFSKLDGRKLPVYPEQSMTPEEYGAFKAKSKVEFSFSAPSFITAPIQQAPVTSPFTFTSSVDKLQPQTGFSVPQPVNLFNTSTNANTSFGFAAGGQAEAAPVADDAPEEDQEEDDEPPMYEGKCTLSVRYAEETEYTECGEGAIHLSYDGDLYCSRFSFFSGDELLVDHIIASDTEIHKIGDTRYAWSGLTETDDGYDKIELDAVFETEAEGAAFMDRFADSQEIASYAGMTEAHLQQDENNPGDEPEGC